MINYVGQRELENPQGARPAERTENERAATILHGSKGGAGSAVFLYDVTQTTARPTASSPVFWFGGTVKPDNMAEGDFWFKVDEDSVTPPVDPPTDPVTIKHSVFSTTEPTQFSGMTTAKEPVLRVANGFYSAAGAESYRTVGMRIWIPEGVTTSSGTAYVYQVTGANPVLSSPLQSKAIPAISTSGWTDIMFTTPVQMTPGVPAYVGYEFVDGTYMYKIGSENTGFIASHDGSKIYLMEESAPYNGFTYQRGFYEANAGGTVIAPSAPFYGIDIIVDEGA